MNLFLFLSVVKNAKFLGVNLIPQTIWSKWFSLILVDNIWEAASLELILFQAFLFVVFLNFIELYIIVAESDWDLSIEGNVNETHLLNKTGSRILDPLLKGL